MYNVPYILKANIQRWKGHELIFINAMMQGWKGHSMKSQK